MEKDVGFHVMFTFVGLIIAAIVAALVVDAIYRRRYRESPNGFLNGTDANDVPVHIYEHTKTANSNGLAVATHQLEAAPRKPKYGYANVPAFLKPRELPLLLSLSRIGSTDLTGFVFFVFSALLQHYDQLADHPVIRHGRGNLLFARISGVVRLVDCKFRTSLVILPDMRNARNIH